MGSRKLYCPVQTDPQPAERAFSVLVSQDSFSLSPDNRRRRRPCPQLFCHALLYGSKGRKWRSPVFLNHSPCFLHDILDQGYWPDRLMTAPCDVTGMIVWQDMVNGGGIYSIPFVCYFPTLFPGLTAHIGDSLTLPAL